MEDQSNGSKKLRTLEQWTKTLHSSTLGARASLIAEREGASYHFIFVPHLIIKALVPRVTFLLHGMSNIRSPKVKLKMPFYRKRNWIRCTRHCSRVI